MLTQLSRLTETVDGRFATAGELQFLKDYLETAPLRINVYKKIRNSAESIVTKTLQKKRTIQPQSFWVNGEDRTDTCRRDMGRMIKFAAAAILFSDLERLRSGTLVWYKTITIAFNFQSQTAQNYKLFQESVNEHLHPEEVKIADPSLKLIQSYLGS
jgi:hypothetical protein